ncbi:MAG TPA: PAS domain-containing protein [Fluviicoccus sp.]|nr:PAS domain-containing protein [Fluviicoccus sp.]
MSRRIFLVVAALIMLPAMSFAAIDAETGADLARLSGVLRGHSAPMMLIDPDSGRILNANDAAATFYGYPASTLVQMRLDQLNVLPPAEIALERQAAAAQQRNYFLFPHRLADGKVRTVEVYSSPVTLDGRTLLLSVILDLAGKQAVDSELKAYRGRLEEMVNSRTLTLESDHQRVRQDLLSLVIFQSVVILLLLVTLFYRRQVQKALLKEKQTIKAMLDSSLQFMGLLDLEGRLLHVNRTALERTGYPESQVTGRLFWETPWWTDAAEERARLKRAVLLAVSGEETRLESVYHLPGGELLSIDFSARPVTDVRGKVINILVEGRDISARKQAEAQVVARRRELQDANNYLKTLISALPDTLMELDGDGRIYQYHSAIAGFPKPGDGHEGWAIRDFLPPEACRVILAAIAQAAGSGLCTGLRFRLDDAGPATGGYELSVTALPESEGSSRRYVILARALRDGVDG